MNPRFLPALLLALPLALSAAPDFRLAKVAGGFEKPLWVGAPAGANQHLWVLEQTGKIWVFRKDTGERLPEPFLDLTGSAVRKDNEQGLLGLAFAPDYQKSGRFYINYTDPKGDTHVSRFQCVEGKPLEGDRDSEERLLFIDQPYGNHNGGWVGFGPDGMLYVGMGDGGAANDPPNNGQKLDTHLGKILRLDVSGPKGYKVPADNPFVSKANASPEIWMWGLRNPWRCSWDRATGDFWIGDVGQNRWEEINFIPARSGAGWNFGWRPREGKSATPTGNIGGEKPPGSKDPIYDYPHDQSDKGGLSVTGGYVYRGPVESIRGLYFFADYQLPRLWSFRESSGQPEDFRVWNEKLKEAGVRMISSFGEDPEGNLYLTDHATGNVLRFAPAG